MNFKKKCISLVLGTICFFPVTLFAQIDTLRIDGSLGMLSTVSKIADAFMKENPAIFVQIGRGIEGSTGRNAGLRDMSIDIALSSKPTKTPESDFDYLLVARSAVVLGVNADVNQKDISSAEVGEILNGTKTSWTPKEVKDSKELHLFIRPADNVDMDVLKTGINFQKADSTAKIGTIVGRPEMLADSLAVTLGAIGVTNMSALIRYPEKIKALSFNGIFPTKETIISGTYPLYRSFIYITKKECREAVTKFCAFTYSDAGKTILESQGAVVLK